MDERAWLTALLTVERALARAQAATGVIPRAAAEAIAVAADPDSFTPEALAELARSATGAGNPVVPLVVELGRRVPRHAAPYVHFGATSQDILDSAAILVVQAASARILTDLAAAADACANLARTHRDTVLAGRTLLQHALPTTFGLKCAGWLVALDDARSALAALRAGRLAVQFGGAAGTLAALGQAGLPVLRRLAEELGLSEPILPWHTDRVRIGQLAGALGTVSGVLSKIALDVLLLAQSEVAEVAEGGGQGHGGSSAMPHKRNPIHSVLVTAATRRVPGLVATLLAAMAQEHERGAGGWHAEWEPLIELLRLVGGAAATTAHLLTGLRVDPARMRANLATSGDVLLAESLAGRLAAGMGRAAAHDLVSELTRTATATGRALRDVLVADHRVGAELTPDEIDAALAPDAALGCAGELVDRALAAHHAGATD